MRKGVNVFHKINGAVYVPMGGGITTAGTSLSVEREINRLYYLAKDVMKYVNENRPNIDMLFSVVKGYNASEARFRLLLDHNGFLIYEEVTHSAVRFEDLGLS
jgi:hypothetical protein